MIPSAAAGFSLSDAEFEDCVSVILVTVGLEKDTERRVLLFGTPVFIIRLRSS